MRVYVNALNSFYAATFLYLRDDSKSFYKNRNEVSFIAWTWFRTILAQSRACNR